MKIRAGLITVFLIFSLLAVPGVFAADNSDPDPSNNQASVTVNPTSNDAPNDTPERTITMLPTGIPLGGILAAILMVLTGFLLPAGIKKK